MNCRTLNRYLIPYVIFLIVITLVGCASGGAPVSSPSTSTKAVDVADDLVFGDFISYDLHRYALVIGNGKYEEGALANPVNDANLMASKFSDAGFDVYLYQNLTKSGMDDAVSSFVKVVNNDKSATAVVYYAGHGVEVEGVNYLIPIDNSKIESEEDVKIYSYSLDNILSLLNAKEQIIILDACRNNPFKMSGDRATGVKGGLGALKDAKKGVTMSYLFAAQSGQTAKDGDGGNSVFTAILAEEIEKGNVPISQLFNNVAARVKAMTNGEQVPLSSTNGSEFIFQSEELSRTVLAKWSEQAREVEAELKRLESKGTDAITLAESQAKVAFAQAEKEASERRAAQLKAYEENARREAEEAAQRSAELQAQIDAMKIAAENAATATRMGEAEPNNLYGLLDRILNSLENINNSEIKKYRDFTLKKSESNTLLANALNAIDNEPYSLADKDSQGNPTELAKKVRQMKKDSEKKKYESELKAFWDSLEAINAYEIKYYKELLKSDVKAITSQTFKLSSVTGDLRASLNQYDGETGGWNLSISGSITVLGKELINIACTAFLSYEDLTGLKKIGLEDVKNESDLAKYYEYSDNVQMFDALFRGGVPIIQVEIDCRVNASGNNHIFTITPSKISIKRVDTNKDISFSSKKALSYLGKGTIELCHDYTVSYSAATCTEDGYLNLKCRNCGATSKEVLEEALGHDFSNGYCSKCGQKVLYKVGEKGPAGGYVFYDKGFYSYGWRYLEAAPSDLKEKYMWGYGGEFGTSTEIGAGKNNTETIASKSTDRKNNAAQACLDYKVNGYGDWFLPSKDELNLMCSNLKRMKLGDFADNVYYWCSSEYDSGYAWSQYFDSGGYQGKYNRSYFHRVRPIRAF